MKFYGMDLAPTSLQQQRIRVTAIKRQRIPLRVHFKLAPEIRTRMERLLFETQLTQSDIALNCNVAKSKVCTIARQIGFGPWMRKSERKSRAQSNRNREIIRLVRKGQTYREIAQRYGITKQRAQQIVKLCTDAISREECRRPR